MQGLRVKCLSCGGDFHETTSKFDPYRTLNGSMFKLQKQFGPRGYNWETFSQDPGLRDADLVCPWCGSCYVGNIQFINEHNERVTMAELRGGSLKDVPEIDELGWHEFRSLASKYGLKVVGISREELTKRLKKEMRKHEKAQKAGA